MPHLLRGEPRHFFFFFGSSDLLLCFSAIFVVVVSLFVKFAISLIRRMCMSRLSYSVPGTRYQVPGICYEDMGTALLSTLLTAKHNNVASLLWRSFEDLLSQ